MRVTDEERARLEAAVREAEATTGAEIVVMVVDGVTDYRAAEMTLAGVAALVVPGALLPFSFVPALWIWLAQLVLFVVLAVLLPLLAGGRRLVGRARVEADVRAAAQAQFFARGLRNTTRRAAVLFFVAPEERCVELLYDDAAASVGEGQWRGVAGTLARGMKGEDPVAAIEKAVAEAGRLLAGRFPREPGDADELPNVIIG